MAFRIERPAVQTALGLALALSGVLWLTGVGTVDVGALVIALNCLCYALYIVLSKRVVERVGAITLVTWLFTWGAATLAPFAGARLAGGVRVWGAEAWILVAFIVVVPTIVAYFANAWALGRSNPTLVTVYIYLQPVLAAVLQWAQLGQPVRGRALVASAPILAGLALVATRRAVRVQA